MRRPNGYGTVVNLGGNRRRPYAVKVTSSELSVDDDGKCRPKQLYIGYYATKEEAFAALEKHNKVKVPIDYVGITFREIWNIWADRHLDEGSASRKKSYTAAIAKCEPLFDKPIASLRLADLQQIFDDYAGASKSSLNNIKIVMQFVFEWAMKNDVIQKNYVEYVEIASKEVKNHKPFTHAEFDDLMSVKKPSMVEELAMMYIFTGVRPNELLELKTEDVHIGEQYFHIKKSKTKSGIRIVPIADKVLPIFKKFYAKSTDMFLEIDYPKYKSAFSEAFGAHTPHDTRSTFISFLTEKDVPQIIIQKIVGHSNGTVTGDVYTQLSLQPLLDAVNKL